MTEVQEIEKAVSDLPAGDFARFRAWFEEFDGAIWDNEFEDDAKAGRLDALAEKAIEDFKAGKCKEL